MPFNYLLYLNFLFISLSLNIHEKKIIFQRKVEESDLIEIKSFIYFFNYFFSKLRLKKVIYFNLLWLCHAYYYFPKKGESC